MKFKVVLASLLLFVAIGANPRLAHSDASAGPNPSPSAVPLLQATSGNISMPEVAAPPAWAQALVVTASNLPVVGPVLSKILVYLPAIVTVLTILAASLLSIIQALASVLNFAGLGSAATFILNFQNGKVMYWLKFFSMFNAKKPDAATASIDAQAPAKAA